MNNEQARTDGAPAPTWGPMNVGRVVLSSIVMPIRREDDVLLVCRKVRALARTFGFDAFATAAVTTASSELAHNALVHGHGGTATVHEVANGGRAGLFVEFCDEGPGIADLERALAGGRSTPRSLGLGLSGAQRLVDDLAVRSGPGLGTTVTITKWRRPY